MIHTRAIAGPKPRHNAATPSCAIVFRAQSMSPEYVPVGADCNLDFNTCARTTREIRSTPWSTAHTHVGGYGERPHRHAGGAAREYDGAEVQVSGRRTGGRQGLLRHFVCREIAAQQMHDESRDTCKVHVVPRTQRCLARRAPAWPPFRGRCCECHPPCTSAS